VGELRELVVLATILEAWQSVCALREDGALAEHAREARTRAHQVVDARVELDVPQSVRTASSMLSKSSAGTFGTQSI
jgi:hypothetical protein